MIKIKGSNQYENKYKYPLGLEKKTWYSVVWLTLALILFAGVLWVLRNPRSPVDGLISPIPKGYIPERIMIVTHVEAVDRNPLDAYVDEAAMKFGKGKDGYSKLKMTLNCLLYYETKHGYAVSLGDGGLAGGLMQFHQATWVRMRKQMIGQGLIKDISSRDDFHDAIFTTAWAIANGRGKEWGPILRGNCK